MGVYLAKALMNVSVDDVRDHFKGNLILRFDDGDIETTGFETTISRYAWEILKKVPKLELSKRYHVRTYMKDSVTFKPSTLSDVFAAIWVDTCENYKMSYQLQSDIWDMFMDMRNRVICDIMKYYARYRMTMNIEDILEVMYDKEILKITEDNPVNKKTIIRPNYIESIYRQKTARLESKALARNNIATMLRCGLIKNGQLMQCIGPRGSVTDINSDIFAEPIQAGYADGLKRIYDVLIESRTAAMSLNNQSGPLQFTEYLSRRIQFIGMQLKHLHFGDCGSKHYFTWQVRASRDNSVMGDLELLEGMNYLDESTGKYRQVKKTDKHLIGKRIKLRTVLGCQHKDPYGVCSTCLGASANNVPKYRNLGHFAIVTLTAIISQLVLSTKHMTSSATSSMIALSDEAKVFMESTDNGLAAKFKDDLHKYYRKLYISVHEECMIGLSDIIEEKDTDILSPKRTSTLNRFKLITVDLEGKEEEHVMDAVSFHDEGFFTSDMLRHMKQHGWVIRDNGMIEIDLKEWDFTKPVLEIISKQFDTFQYSKGIEKLLKSSVDELRNRATNITPESFIMELIDIVNHKLHINFGIMQVVAYTMLCVDIIGKDYSLPKPWTLHSVGNLDSIVRNRSLSAALSYERHATIMRDPTSYLVTNRMDHPMDEMFVPDQMDLAFLKVKPI